MLFRRAISSLIDRSAGQEHGYALVTAIWLSGLLAVSATAFLAETKSEVTAASALAGRKVLEHAAHGYFNVVALAVARQGGNLESLSVPLGCRWDSSIVVKSVVQDQGGLVDLNTGHPTLLRAALQGRGLSAQQTADAFEAIQDFKDPDTITSSGEDEIRAYSALAFGPKNLPFVDPAELDQIPQIADDVALLLAEDFTVHSQQQGIDPAVANTELLGRLQNHVPNLADYTSPSPKRVFAITVEARRRETTGAFAMRGVINLVLQPEQPFATLSWATVSPLPEPQANSGELPECPIQ